ncbi:hypothetical protein BDQ17DRAFT_1335672 [Cyathus striatus]|nr:hypothetical protein BDQ17DRAFT_1335672 [Cyathus striatus]
MTQHTALCAPKPTTSIPREPQHRKEGDNIARMYHYHKQTIKRVKEGEKRNTHQLRQQPSNSNTNLAAGARPGIGTKFRNSTPSSSASRFGYVSALGKDSVGERAKGCEGVDKRDRRSGRRRRSWNEKWKRKEEVMRTKEGDERRSVSGKVSKMFGKEKS